MLRNKTFAPEFCSLISNQAPGANLLHESVSGASSLVCTEICLPWHDVSPVGQSNWLIFFIHNSSHAPIGLFHHSAPSSCPSCVLVGVLTRERVSGACFRSKLPRVYRPLVVWFLAKFCIYFVQIDGTLEDFTQRIYDIKQMDNFFVRQHRKHNRKEEWIASRVTFWITKEQ